MLAISGQDVMSKLNELHQTYLPNILIAGSNKDSNQALLKNRYIEDETLIYVCVNNSCKLPVTEIKDAIALLKE